MQNQILDHVWDHPSIVTGPGGDMKLDGNTGPEDPPWRFNPFQNPSETFISRDGNALIAAETLGRHLYPSLVLEAEDFTASSGTVNTQSNNTMNPNHYNGGISVVSIDDGDWLEFDFQPPAKDTQNYQYVFILRVANTSASSADITLDLDAGAWTEVVSVNPTGHEHVYEIAMSSAVPLTTGTNHTLRLTFEEDLVFSMDSVTVKSEGLPQ